jgi:SAM-dependent methyltransferase
MAQKPVTGETRTIEQLREHYEIEKDLADRLRRASREERRSLYSSLYDEMYRRVPLHPQRTRKSSPQKTELVVSEKIRLIKGFLRKDITFLEVGPGDCALSFEVAKSVRQVYAVDVCAEITNSLTRPANFQLVLSDGTSIPLPPNSVDVAYSDQLMEHLHPDDASAQLENIYRALIPGGVYLCMTPNRLNGPHDISRYFDKVATGFHLKEYTTLELSRLFRRVGFSRVRVHVWAKGKCASLPPFPSVLLERLLEILPSALRRTIARKRPFESLLGIRLVGIK